MKITTFKLNFSLLMQAIGLIPKRTLSSRKGRSNAPLNLFFIKLFLAFAICSLGSHPLHAQSELNDDDQSVTFLEYTGAYEEFLIPANPNYNAVEFFLRGGDGGYASADGICTSYGGDGAKVRFTLLIGEELNQIPPGTKLRFIVGEAGDDGYVEGNILGNGWSNSAGGGGTAVLAYLNDAWEILAVAGGGGGAYQGMLFGECINSQGGQGGRATENGGDGHGTFGGDGGTDGGGGTGGGDATVGKEDLGAGGGGAFGDGGTTRSEGSQGGHKGFSEGGDGGYCDVCFDGGWGFGGGGSSDLNGGGGGGGYSGGGGGSQLDNGGGGGSYISSLDMVIESEITQGERDAVTTNGRITYYFRNVCTAKITGDEWIVPNCSPDEWIGVRLLYDIYGWAACSEQIDFELLPDYGWQHQGNGEISFRPNRADVYTVYVKNTLYDITVSSYTLTLDQVDPTVEAHCKDLTINLDDGNYSNLNFASLIDDGSFAYCPDGFTLSASRTSFDCTDLGDNEVVLTITGSNGLTDQCTSIVTFRDIRSPVWSGETGFKADVYLDENGEGSVTRDNLTNLEYLSDNCASLDELTWTLEGNNFFTCSAIGVNPAVLRYTIVDPSGNMVQQLVEVTVYDTVAPKVVTKDVVVKLSSPGQSTNPISIFSFFEDYGDNCISDALIYDAYRFSSLPDNFPSGPYFDCDDIGTYTGTIVPGINSNIFDAANHPPSVEITLTITDAGRPNISCQDVNIQLANHTATATISTDDVVTNVSENCSSVALNLSQTTFSCTDQGTQTLEVTGTDDSGNIGSCAFNVTVSMQQSLTPVAACQDITVQLDNSGAVSITSSDIDNGSTVGCGTISMSLDQLDFDCDDIGDNTVTLTILDEGGSSSACTAKVTVEDNTAPTAVCQDLTIELTDDQDVIVSGVDFDGGSSDNCGIASISIPENEISVGCQNTPTGLTLEVSVTDFAGNTATCTSKLSAQDVVPPSMKCKDITVTLDENGIGQYKDSDLNDGSTDNCDLAESAFTLFTVDCEDIGTFEATFTYTDISGNSASCTGEVTVVEPVPVASCQDITVDLDELGSVAITPSQIDNGSTLACDDWDLSLDISSFDCDDIGTNTVSLLLTTGTDITAVCEANVEVRDLIGPKLLCIDERAGRLDADGNLTVPLTDLYEEISDACGVASIEANQTTFDCFDVGLQEITLTATDNNGNSSSCTVDYDVRDDTDPTAVCKDITLSLGTDGEVSLTVDQLDNGSFDNCSWEDEGISQTKFDCSHLGENIVELDIIDGEANGSTCESKVTIVDDTPPVALCPNVTVALGENGEGTVTPAMIAVGSTDNCSIVSTTIIGGTIEYDCEDIGSTFEVSLQVSDAAGLSSTCTATVMVEDPNSECNQAPTATCQNITVNVGDDCEASITPEQIDDGSSDPNGDLIGLSLDNIGPFGIGEHPVILTATDGALSSTCSATVTVEDNAAPVATCQDLTIQLDDNGLATITAAAIDNGSNDACGLANLSLDKASFDCTNVGGNTVTLTATDVNTNSSTCTATVTVEDETAPVASCQDLTIQLDNNGLAAITAAAIDNGSNDACGIANLSLDKASFDCTNVGSNTVTLTATDVNTNSSICTATLTVEDETAPVASCQDLTIQLDNNGLAAITAAAIDNGSNDACGIANLSLDKASFDCTNVGSNTVTLTATDVNTNSSTCTAIVTVEDDIQPTLTCPQDMTVNTDAGECGAYVTLPKAAPVDNCGTKNLKSRYRALDEAGSPTGSWSSWESDHSGFFELGTYQIQWRAKDESNNKGFCSFTLNVIDQEAPTVACQDISINFNGEATIAIDPTAIFDEAASFDACGTVAFVSQSISEVSCQDIGQTLVAEVVAADPSGNTGTCSAQISVTGLPCGFQASDIYCSTGAAATYDPQEERFTLTADDCSGYPDGEWSLVTTELCEDGEIIANISSLSSNARVGVIMMEENVPGARFVSKIKDLTPRTRTEYRSSTGGSISFKSKNRTNVKWVRIVRDGSKFKTYTSTNGSYWRLSHSITFPSFNDCIYAGLVLYSKDADTPATAVIKHVKVMSDATSSLTASPDAAPASIEGVLQTVLEKGLEANLQLSVVPNPFAEQTQIEFTLPKATDVTLEIYNLHGQRVRNLESAQLDAGTHRYQWDGQSSKGEPLPTGIYMLRLRVDKKWVTSKVSLIDR